MDELNHYLLLKFSRAARYASRSSITLTEGEWQVIGLKRFKRKVLGFCNNETTLTLEELAHQLKDLGMSKSFQESQEIITQLRDRSIYKDSYQLTFQYLPNKPAYRITYMRI